MLNALQCTEKSQPTSNANSSSMENTLHRFFSPCLDNAHPWLPPIQMPMIYFPSKLDPKLNCLCSLTVLSLSLCGANSYFFFCACRQNRKQLSHKRWVFCITVTKSTPATISSPLLSQYQECALFIHFTSLHSPKHCCPKHWFIPRKSILLQITSKFWHDRGSPMQKVFSSVILNHGLWFLCSTQ